jgi:hypothetical protein
MVTIANAMVRKGAAEAEVRRKVVEAENAVSPQILLRDVCLHAIDAMPELARELMSPAKAIREIKVLQTTSMGGRGGLSIGRLGRDARSDVAHPEERARGRGCVSASARAPGLREGRGRQAPIWRSGGRSTERRQRDPARLGERPDPRRRAQRQEQRDAEPSGEPVDQNRVPHEYGRAELRGAR